jgi:ketosteroid isomerase-like protein
MNKMIKFSVSITFLMIISACSEPPQNATPKELAQKILTLLQQGKMKEIVPMMYASDNNKKEILAKMESDTEGAAEAMEASSQIVGFSIGECTETLEEQQAEGDGPYASADCEITINVKSKPSEELTMTFFKRSPAGPWMVSRSLMM